MINKKITCIKIKTGFSLNKEYSVFVSKLTENFNSKYIISDLNQKIILDETLIDYFVYREILNLEFFIFKDRNIFHIYLHEINTSQILSEINFNYLKHNFKIIGDNKVGSTFKIFKDKNNKTITFIKNSFNTWKCAHNDFYLKSLENPTDFKIYESKAEKNFIDVIIEQDLQTNRFLKC